MRLMKFQTIAICSISAFVLTAASAVVGGAALAQQGSSAGQSDRTKETPQEQIEVVGPRIIRSHVGGPGSLGNDVLTLTHHVGYGDLDLARSADAKTLEQRIRDSADEVCTQLAKVPPEEPKSQDCVQQAVNGAMRQAREAIADAQRSGRQ
jgi:UrcA family protein